GPRDKHGMFAIALLQFWRTGLEFESQPDQGCVGKQKPENAIEVAKGDESSNREKPYDIDQTVCIGHPLVGIPFSGGVLIGVTPMRFIEALAPLESPNQCDRSVNDKAT